MKFSQTMILASLLVAAVSAPAFSDTVDDLITKYSADAGAGFKADPARGKAFFLADHTGGKPDTPSCSTCHTKDPTKPGKSPLGKSIDPMALSASPDRFSEPDKVEKRFGRYCNDVLGRDCTAGEKADFIAYLKSI